MQAVFVAATFASIKVCKSDLDARQRVSSFHSLLCFVCGLQNSQIELNWIARKLATNFQFYFDVKLALLPLCGSRGGKRPSHDLRCCYLRHVRPMLDWRPQCLPTCRRAKASRFDWSVLRYPASHATKSVKRRKRFVTAVKFLHCLFACCAVTYCVCLQRARSGFSSAMQSETTSLFRLGFALLPTLFVNCSENCWIRQLRARLELHAYLCASFFSLRYISLYLSIRVRNNETLIILTAHFRPTFDCCKADLFWPRVKWVLPTYAIRAICAVRANTAQKHRCFEACANKSAIASNSNCKPLSRTNQWMKQFRVCKINCELISMNRQTSTKTQQQAKQV